MVIRSQQFDDIYFSVEDGLAETEFVFLKGNHLPEAWQGRARFCIGELGFGTGLNILSVWKLFEEMAKADQRLDIVSIEKYPLSRAQIAEALSAWRPQLGRYLDRLIDAYPMIVPGFHQIHLSDRVTLTLVFDDVRTALKQITARVDVWFLDGFAPAKNPDMWSADVFEQIARLSNGGATFATFTAAGDVRRGLAAVGFDVEKTRGYGRKRDMTVGRFIGVGPVQDAPRKVAIVGAGLAGASAAWHLKRAGIDVEVYEARADIAPGASGNSTGIMNPKLTVQRGAQSDYYTAAFAYARRYLPTLNPCGSLHLQMDEDKARKFDGYISNLGWHADHMKMLNADEASDVAGVKLDQPCLFYPDAGFANPRAIVETLLKDIPVHLNTRVEMPEADAVVFATAHDAVTELPLQKVRGQVSRLRPNDASMLLKANLCYGGYLSPVQNDGLHMCGATFQPWDEDAAVRDDDHARNIAQLTQAVPSIGAPEVQDGWTGFRAAAKDRFPAIGQHNTVWVSVAHGSHGMISGLMGGAILAARLTGAPLPISAESAAALDPARLDSTLRRT